VGGVLSFYNADFYRRYHQWHHRYTHQPGLDPELEGGTPSSRLAYGVELSGLPWWMGKLLEGSGHAHQCRGRHGAHLQLGWSINLSSGIIEIGQGTYTGIAQIVAGRFGIDPDDVHVNYEINTRLSPHDWATAASRSLFMAGRAALAAADDAIDQIKRIASDPLRCPVDDLEVLGGRVYLRDDPDRGLDLSDVVLGYQYPDGSSIGGQVIGRGKYISRGLTGARSGDRRRYTGAGVDPGCRGG